MNRTLAGWMAACMLLLAHSAVAQQAPPEAAAFAAMPEMMMVRLTPDGRRVAWASDRGGKPVIVMFDLDAGQELRRLQVGDAVIRSLDWADNTTLLATISTTRSINTSTVAEKKYEFFRTLAADVTGGELRPLLMADPNRRYVTSASIVRLSTGKPETILMSTPDPSVATLSESTGSYLFGGRKDLGWPYSLFEVSTRTGAGKKIEAGTPFTEEWIVDAQSQPAANSEWNPENREFTVLARQGRSWKPIFKSKDGETFNLDAISSDGRSIVARSSLGEGRIKAWSLPMDGSDISLLFEHPVHDVTATITDRYTGAPNGFRIGGLEPTIHWIDPGLATLQKSLERAFANLRVEIFDRSQDLQRVIVRTESAASPPIYYLVDRSRGTADIVGEAYPALIDVPLGSLQATAYAARDEVMIPSYLTLPPGREPAKLPLVVLPHGGPHARDDTRFDWLVQFLATRGYAVLQPQFRGSTGFGTGFQRAGERQWGRGMQDDITDGVRDLIGKGIVDPARVCIVGGSYGGYAALAGAAFTPELYACAVSINGVADIPSFLGFVQRQYGDESDSLRFWRDVIGHPADQDLARFSPLRSIATVRAPILLIHSTDDSIVPLAQSDTIAEALKKEGKAHQFIRLPGEDHWLSTTPSRLAVLQALEAFLASSLKAP